MSSGSAAAAPTNGQPKPAADSKSNPVPCYRCKKTAIPKAFADSPNDGQLIPFCSKKCLDDQVAESAETAAKVITDTEGKTDTCSLHSRVVAKTVLAQQVAAEKGMFCATVDGRQIPFVNCGATVSTLAGSDGIVSMIEGIGSINGMVTMTLNGIRLRRHSDPSKAFGALYVPEITPTNDLIVMFLPRTVPLDVCALIMKLGSEAYAKDASSNVARAAGMFWSLKERMAAEALRELEATLGKLKVQEMLAKANGPSEEEKSRVEAILGKVPTSTAANSATAATATASSSAPGTSSSV